MNISIVTTVTNPDTRQDPWREALTNYSVLADEIVVVNGGDTLDLSPWPKARQLILTWPNEWHWIEIERHRNAGVDAANGDWIIGFDIDQFIHEDDVGFIRDQIEIANRKGDLLASLLKHSTLYGGRYFVKGQQPIAFRNGIGLRYGRDRENPKDHEGAFVVQAAGIEDFGEYPRIFGIRKSLAIRRIGAPYWNYDYCFKTEDVSRQELWRYEVTKRRSFQFGAVNESESLAKFIDMQQWRYEHKGVRWNSKQHPEAIRAKMDGLQPGQFGHSAWGKARL